ncbi:Di-copper centre-containing protein [Daldinia caldariorum]|uniref:Di-copper centre-containing protein n=1 Tax=Daldinia caldariorum TaxID=326644 RepID=UPI002008B595|nr:Di-copper centre-containing protein [Daldinia caldariorum]KAI1466640.1 Di-copper centre-containing protein [Daldinia caldariorum]
MSSIHRICLVFALLFSVAVAGIQLGQYDYGFTADLRLRKRAPSQSSIVAGPPRVNGEIQLRPDIRDLQKDEDKWNLYLLALSWMQFTDQESPFSWYQITGIHGAPALTWEDVDPTPGNEHSGYCTHVSILFPPWHRPYLALYEQVLYNIVQFIASFYPPELQDRFQKAADTFRIPYWDWAAVPPKGDSVLPPGVGDSPFINVTGPNGVQTIANPLFSYVFRPFNSSTFPDFPYNTWRETKRAPRPINSANATSNNTFVAHALDIHLPSFQQRLYNLFSHYPNYTTFSNEAWITGPNNGTYDSLESIHDAIHTVGGGVYGHLAIIAYSGFDPLFWLHHTNVDRIFTMWQHLYNDTYVIPQAAVYSSHTTSPGQLENSQTPLTPFFVNETHFWTADMVRDHEVFGYTYAEVANTSRAELVTTINKLYGKFSPASIFIGSDRSLRHSSRHTKRSSHRESYRANGISWSSQSSNRPSLGAIFRGGKYREWIANIRVNKQAMGGSFSIHLFLGDVPPDPSLWPVAPNLVGTHGIFAHKSVHGHVSDRMVTGTIPITSALMHMVASGKVPSLHAEDAEPFLRSNLQVRVSLANGKVINARHVSGLCINIVSSMVKAPESDNMLSEWGDMETHFNLLA